tara:strand:+ start:59 stop:448 length:390 start_codon:yes stop_codon:yes gene_type:complete
LDSYKILKQAAPGDSNWAEAYQVPVPAATTVNSGAVTVGPKAVSAQTQTLITSILVISSDSSTYSIAVGDSSLAAVDVAFTNMIVYQKALAASNNDVLSLGLTLGSGDKIFFKEDTGTVAYTIMGIEIT